MAIELDSDVKMELLPVVAELVKLQQDMWECMREVEQLLGGEVRGLDIAISDIAVGSSINGLGIEEINYLLENIDYDE